MASKPAFDPKGQIHVKLKKNLCGLLTVGNLEDLKDHAEYMKEPNIKKGDASNIKTTREFLQKLEEQGHLEEGNYDTLKQLCSGAELGEAVKMIEKTERELQEAAKPKRKRSTSSNDIADQDKTDIPSTSQSRNSEAAKKAKMTESADVLLSQKHKLLLKQNKVELISNLRVDFVLIEMEAKLIFNDDDVQKIKTTPGGSNKVNEAFMDTLEKTSEKGFLTFLGALRKSNQSALANLLQ